MKALGGLFGEIREILRVVLFPQQPSDSRHDVTVVVVKGRRHERPVDGARDFPSIHRRCIGERPVVIVIDGVIVLFVVGIVVIISSRILALVAASLLILAHEEHSFFHAVEMLFEDAPVAVEVVQEFGNHHRGPVPYETAAEVVSPHDCHRIGKMAIE